MAASIKTTPHGLKFGKQMSMLSGLCHTHQCFEGIYYLVVEGNSKSVNT